MRRRSRVNPFLPIPQTAQRRMLTLLHLGLADLAAGQAGESARDLYTAARLAEALMAGRDCTPEALQAPPAARAALELLARDAGSPAAAAAACAPLVDVFEGLLRLVPAARFERVRRELAAAEATA